MSMCNLLDPVRAKPLIAVSRVTRPLTRRQGDEAVDLELELTAGEKLNNGRADAPRTALVPPLSRYKSQ